ncbi:MAG: hypothetical protein JWR67_1126 [Mucilaginibacter sp.]|nr:hypothetical protein [Mucilaginibacter sp.]
MLKKVNLNYGQKYFFNLDTMFSRNKILIIVISLIITFSAKGQSSQIQQGVLIKLGTNDRLFNAKIVNKHNLYKARSNGLGLFSIVAQQGDTLEISADNYNTDTCIIKNLVFKKIYLTSSSLELKEVVIYGSSLKQNLQEAQNGYRRKSVFYTGTPHYYYLVLKPMTFIYENFKSEVKEARRFKKFAKRELENDKIYQRFNNYTIKKVIPIKDKELDDFKSVYTPTIEQINLWNDYDMAVYLKKSYKEFLKKNSH